VSTHEAFRHEAMLYAGRKGFLDGTLAFIEDALVADEPILVVVGAEKMELLRVELGTDAGRVHFADMGEVGTNPAWIIPAWRDFVSRVGAGGGRLRGIGEPIFPGRSPEELVECHRHEALLNLAFADTGRFWLLCPYDTDALHPAVIEHALRNHPVYAEDGVSRQSESYGGLEAVSGPFTEPLPEPPHHADKVLFHGGSLKVLREWVFSRGGQAGMSPAAASDLVLAVNELATNSVCHAGGHGALRVWEEGGSVVCEIRDNGCIGEPLIGRERPATHRAGGSGLWMVNQLCQLVQIRSSARGSIVRMRMRRS
jgi:anti-sigma regulatory factor (Ser/Thr protein kinase)